MHFVIPKVLLKDQKMLNLRRIKNDERGPSDFCASLTHLLTETGRSKKTGFYVKICIKARLEIEKTQVLWSPPK